MCEGADVLLADVEPEVVMADKGYDAMACVIEGQG